MQFLIDHLQTLGKSTPALILGYILLAGLTLQVLLMLYGTVRRLWLEREQQRLALQKLKLQVKAAALHAREIEQTKSLWHGFRKFEVKRKVQECADVYSFYLTPHDRKLLPAFKPGQYLTFQLNIPGQTKPVIRCYSLSESPNHPDYYRVTIKKVCVSPDQPGCPPGIASTYFCDSVKVGDILDVKSPAGNFTLDSTRENPVVLIAGGVGVTPMLSMVNAIAESGAKREVWFFFGLRNRAEHIQKEHLEQLAAKHNNIHLHVCYSRPGSEDLLNRDYQHGERVCVDVMKRLLPSNNYEFFICGPGAMMKSITEDLAQWGVPEKNIFFEAFGPATVKKAVAPTLLEPEAPGLDITFSRSGKVCRWKSGGSLLEFAEANGIRIESGCRAGSCGTCLVAIKSGSVDYLTEHVEAEEGSCLTCMCRPRTSLVLDA